MTIALSPRLAAIAELVLPGLPVADIGTDHAYLPIALVQSGKVPRAIASDIAEKPLAAARHAVAAEGVAKTVDVRSGSGLTTLAPGQAGTIVIAGMGGYLIRNIMAASPGIALDTPRFVLQPMRDAATLRRWLWDNGWLLVDERLAQEGDRFYTAIAAERGQSDDHSFDRPRAAALARAIGVSEDLVVELGPLVVSAPDPLFAALLDRELDIVAGLTAEIEAGALAATESRSLVRRRETLARRRHELRSLSAWLRGQAVQAPET